MRTILSPGTAIAALLCAGATVQGGALQFCPGNAGGICYSVGVPASSASSGSGNIYMQISAPATYQWVALGTGTGMAGSNMFIVYQDGKGNVTASPRKGALHVMPTLDTSATAARLTVLAGSGLSADGATLTANLACANCQSWSGGGTLDFNGTETSWISAWKKGSAIATTSASATLQQHDDTAIFQLDLTKAVISADSNPFLAAGNSSTNSTGGTGSGSGSSTGGATPVKKKKKHNHRMLVAHGAITALIFSILFPVGSIMMPLVGKWWAHAWFQTFVWAFMWAGFGLGIRCAIDRDELFTEKHTIIGTVVICLLLIQPALGYAHHRYYLKHQQRGVFSHVHIWYGRILMILGIINGGLGLQWSKEEHSYIIAYSVLSGVLFLLYVIVKVLPKSSKTRSSEKSDTGSPA